MNKTPSILVDTGFETDQNGVLTEIVFPEVVHTQNMPSIVTTNATTINWMPSNTSTLTQFNALKLQELNSGLLAGYSILTTVNMPALRSISTSSNTTVPFNNCTALTTVNMPALSSIYLSGAPSGVFNNCTSLVEITLPSLLSITHNSRNQYGGTFMGCTGLTTVNLPMLQTLVDTATDNQYYGTTFKGCASLQNVTFGSEGHPVTRISNNPFYGLSQSSLTITIYTTGGAALSGAPWGATNATIEYEEA